MIKGLVCDLLTETAIFVPYDLLTTSHNAFAKLALLSPSCTLIGKLYTIRLLEVVGPGNFSLVLIPSHNDPPMPYSRTPGRLAKRSPIKISLAAAADMRPFMRRANFVVSRLPEMATCISE